MPFSSVQVLVVMELGCSVQHSLWPLYLRKGQLGEHTDLLDIYIICIMLLDQTKMNLCAGSVTLGKLLHLPGSVSSFAKWRQ